MSTLPARMRVLWTFEGLVLGALFVMVSGLAFLFPPSGDDWAWGSDEGVQRLHSHFANYNGRYLGNMAVLVLTRTPWATPFVIALTLCLLLRLLVEIAGLRTPVGYLVGAALIVAMPLGEWRQTIVWISGFSNYTLGALCLLVFVLAVQRDWQAPMAPSPIRLAAVFVFATASQLLIEHVTVFILLASLANVFLQLRRPRRHLSSLAVVWAMGAVSGAAVMFSNSAYRTVVGGGEANQGLAAAHSEHGPLVSIILQGSRGISQYAVATNTVLNLLLFLLVLALALREKEAFRSASLRVAAVILSGAAAALSVAVQSAVEPGHYYGTLSQWSWIPAASQLAAIVLAAKTLVRDHGRSVSINWLAASVVVLLGPMAVVTPFGPRNFLPSYLLLALVALLLLKELSEDPAVRIVPALAAGLGAVVALATLTSYFAVYVVIHREADRRLDHLREAAQQNVRNPHVYTLPFQDHVHNPDPIPLGGQDGRFKRYYGLPPRMRIHLIDRYANQQIAPPRAPQP
jgi:hypothetical protein